MPKELNPKRAQEITAARQALRTPRAAAVAGILFALLFTTSIVLIRLALPESIDPAGTEIAFHEQASNISLALTLVPFAGIAFLWFMGVVRSHLGAYEDQFFATVFFGSGLLFLAMMFTAAAIAGGILASYAVLSSTLVESGVLNFARSVMYTITNIYAIRMAGVFMISLATIWIRTRVMPRVFVIITYLLALILLLAVNLSLWLILIFPGWVLFISVFILMVTLRGKPAKAEGAVGASET